MSDKAVILLKQNKTVKIKNFTNPQFTIDGKVISFFSDSGDKYIFCEEIKVSDLGIDNIQTIIEGYYSENHYLNFKKEKSHASFSSLVISNFDRYLIPAAENDKIQVEKIKFFTPYKNDKNLTKKITYELNFKSTENYIKADGSIMEPSNQDEIVEKDMILSEHARNFYFSNVETLISIDPVLEFRKVLILTKASIIINNIINSIFPLLDDPAFDELKILQINFWKQNIFAYSDENVLNNYLDRLRSFYKIAYDKQKLLKDSSKDEKLFILLLSLSEKALSIFTPENKIELLNKIYLKKLSILTEKAEYENLVIKIILSFYPDDTDSINLFLTRLTSERPEINNDKVLYQCLYDSMSTSFAITEGVIGIINHVFSSDFKPTKTKAQFVESIYTLWHFSKYNPYKEDGTYKENTINLKSSSPSLVTITKSTTNINYTFNYTNYIAFDPKYETINSNNFTYNAITDFELKRPDAAPIIIPYYSEKFLGVFWDDYSFNFKGSKIEVYQKLKPILTTPNTSTPDPDDYIVYNNGDVINQLYGTYDIYQPITLLNTNIETRSAISHTSGEDINLNGQNINSFIPVFVLAFIDQDSSRGNTETLIGYTVDVATTFAGITNLTKLRHLKWATKTLSATEIGLFTIDGLRVVVGGVEFSSGVLSFLGNFIECDENSEFCKGIKTFLSLLQLACLTINVGDGIASLAAKRQARNVANIADRNGSNSNSVDNLTHALGGSDTARETANKILQFADSSSQFESLNAIVDRVRQLLTNNSNTGLFDIAKRLSGEQQFIPTHYSLNDMREIVSHLFTKAEVFGPAFDKLCSHFMFIGSKEGKLISKDRLVKQITFFYDEVLKRGYPSGFNRTDKIFEVFCGKSKTYFSAKFKFWNEDTINKVVNQLNDSDLTKYIDANWLNFNFTKRIELVVQGSSIRKYIDGEILEHLNASDFLLDAPDDFEFALRLKPQDFEVFTYIARQYAKEKKLTFDFQNVSNKGFMKLDGIERLFGENFIIQFRQTIRNDVNFLPNKINFAIVKEGGPYDLEPFLKFKY
ncbi:hypothetical protein [Flavobacterium sp. IB48]|uniref:hypothetical protein n=1 Tax=Flavobacterium sp. IB48 TaxID=2779375 RepID=UPI0018E7E354|nr:hypothetical protein [Flavobacterium sp. IB48]MBJ2125346.1 hypothetical protein [Flavobacterium sp. IB48]